jgi:hypothetical protein
MYTEEDLKNQIEAWHFKDTPYVINSLKMNFRKSPCPGVFIYKRTGSTAGQVVSLDLVEMELLIMAISLQIIPDIEEFYDEKKLQPFKNLTQTHRGLK